MDITLQQLYSFLLGLATTVLVTFLKKAEWSRSTKIFIVIGVAAILGVLQDVVTIAVAGGQITLRAIMVDIAVIFGSASTLYTLIWDKIEPRVNPPTNTPPAS